MKKTLSNCQALTSFPELEFQGDLRPSQRAVVELAQQKLDLLVCLFSAC